MNLKEIRVNPQIIIDMVKNYKIPAKPSKNEKEEEGDQGDSSFVIEHIV